MMQIDSHYHLDESMVSLPGLIAGMDAFGINKIALIPNMCPPLSLPTVADYVMPLFRRMIHGKQGLLHKGALMIYQSAVKGDGTVDLLGAGYEIKIQPRNDDVIGALERYPERFFGWVFVNPAGPVEPLAEIERCMKTPGMIGVKAHPFWHDYEVSLLRDVAARCSEKGWPMLVHLGVGDKGDYQLLPEAFPKLKIIYAHAGIPYSREIVTYAGGKKSVFVDLSSSSYVDLNAARNAIRLAGADKCLFGSDGPYFHADNDRFDFKPFLEMIKALELTAADRERVMGANFLEITGA